MERRRIRKTDAEVDMDAIQVSHYGAAEGESALGEGARDAPTVAPLEQGKYLDLIKYLQNSLPSLDLDLIT